MLIPDLILLAAVLALAAWRLFAPAWRPRLRVAAVALGFLLAAGQWALCDFTWQDLPAASTAVSASAVSCAKSVVLRLRAPSCVANGLALQNGACQR